MHMSMKTLIYVIIEEQISCLNLSYVINSTQFNWVEELVYFLRGEGIKNSTTFTEEYYDKNRFAE